MMAMVMMMMTCVHTHTLWANSKFIEYYAFAKHERNTRTARQRRAYQSFCLVCQRYVCTKNIHVRALFLFSVVAAAVVFFVVVVIVPVPDLLRRADEDLYSSNTGFLAHSFEF